jgi:hypothetical protein
MSTAGGSGTYLQVCLVFRERERERAQEMGYEKARKPERERAAKNIGEKKTKIQT